MLTSNNTDVNQQKLLMYTLCSNRIYQLTRQVQSLPDLYTDWLATGDTSEIISLLSADNDIGFQVLIASPLNANIILKRLADRGFADATKFEGLTAIEPSSVEKSTKTTVGKLLEDIAFWDANRQYQAYMDHNIQVLRQALGLKRSHLVNIPALFHLPSTEGRTSPYFPNMVNHYVMEDTSLVIRPKGPIINGRYAFEAALEHSLPKRNVRFFDDWNADISNNLLY